MVHQQESGVNARTWGEHTDNGTFLNDEARALGYRVLGCDKPDITM